MPERLRIAVIGGGPAGLMAADTLAPHAEVDLYEHGKHIGRKFLVAGQGGFNLTNAAAGPELLAHYAPTGFLDTALTAFGPPQLREWLQELGIPTFVGTSGRVFPRQGIKPIDVLARIRERLLARDVRIHTEHAFTGFGTDAGVQMENREGPYTLDVDRVVFALGGASWPVTGSTGIWPPLFASLGIATTPFSPSNCGVEVAWPAALVEAHAGKPLKNVRITAGGHSALGEATLTRYGLEGNAVYPVVPAIRDGAGSLRLDLKPDSSLERLVERIGGKSPRNYAAAINLDRLQLALVKAFTPAQMHASPEHFVQGVKDLWVPVRGLRPIGEAISSAGGIPVEELNDDFSLRKHPRIFTIGEMVDWDAPTGGFLLQGCFAMGHRVGRALADQGR